jgi:ATP-dependent Lhr-like helicase
MLDMLCLSGEVAWGRLSAAPTAATSALQLIPATPVALCLREHADAWHALRPEDEAAARVQELGAPAAAVLDLLRARGASFLNDLAHGSKLEGDQLRHALGALVAAGLARSDGFSGLRLLLHATRDRTTARERAGQFAGRWTAVQTAKAAPEQRERALDAQAWSLLRRYGVVFRRLLTREANAAPWRDLTRVYRRLEARGEIRGGRFVAGMSGEQFATPEAIERMREVRRTRADRRLTIVSTADPLNLVGIVTPGERLRTAIRNRIAYRDGVPLAVMEGEDMRELTPLDPSTRLEVARALVRQRKPIFI